MKFFARALAVVLVALVLGGCRGSAQPPAVKVGNDRAAIDFRDVVSDRPTRAEVGMGEEGYVTFPTGSGRRTVPTALQFPGGTVKRSFFQINIGTNYAFSLDRDPTHLPTDFEFFLQAADLAEAQRILREDADPLGLTEAEIDDVTAEGTSVEQGFIDGPLSTEVEVRATGDGDGTLNLIYTVAIGTYHDEAIDKVVRDGAMTLDLTSRPTRADLGFLPDYDDSSIYPEPGRKLSLTLRTPTGRATVPADSVLSDGTEDEVRTTVVGATATLDAALDGVGAAAQALGFDEAAVASMLRAAGPETAQREFLCASTEDYTCALRVTTTTSGGDQDSAAYRITFTYR